MSLMLHMQSNSSGMTHQYASLPGLLCLPVQSQEHGGDSGRQVVTLGELQNDLWQATGVNV